MNYKVMIGDQLYKIAMSSGEFYKTEYDRDVIVYTVDEDELVIHARIENPSEHTLYLISQGRCYLWLDTKMTRKWNRYRGYYSEGPDQRHS